MGWNTLRETHESNPEIQSKVKTNGGYKSNTKIHLWNVRSSELEKKRMHMVNRACWLCGCIDFPKGESLWATCMDGR